jgi:hypothetical protein
MPQAVFVPLGEFRLLRLMQNRRLHRFDLHQDVPIIFVTGIGVNMTTPIMGMVHEN